MSSVNNIPDSWQETTLGEVCKPKGGKRLPKGETLISERTNHPYIRITDFEGNSINKNNLQYVPDETFKKISRYIVNEGDVIISIVGTIGLVALIDDELDNASLTENCVKLTKLESIHNVFLYYYLISKYGQYEIDINTVGAVQKKLPIYGVENINLFLPPLSEQKAIANILTAFDDKIELLQAQNKTLEELAQTIFKEWFGKYQIGDELPDGWRITQLRELAKKISKGTTPRKKDVEGLDGIISFLKVRDISDGGLINKDSLELIPKEVHNKQLKRSILKHNDILFSIAGTIGRVAIVDNELENSNCNQALAFIRLNEVGKFKEYVHLWLKSNDVQNEITNSIVQGVQANVSLTVLGDLKITIPDESKLKEWKSLISPIYSKLDNNNSQIQTLKQTRDTLLPKLMSGEVRVNEFKI